MNCGWAGLEMSKRWMPSKPTPTGWPPQVWLAVLDPESHERTSRLP
jgi:hypothetical protein